MERPLALPVTAQEQAILDRVARGLTNDEIGAELGISESTVKWYVGRLCRRFGAGNRPSWRRAPWPSAWCALAMSRRAKGRLDPFLGRRGLRRGRRAARRRPPREVRW